MSGGLVAEDEDDSFPPAYRELVEPSQPTPRLIRAWALEAGLPVGVRGRIPERVVVAFAQRHQG